MSVVNEFSAVSIRVGSEPKQLLLVDDAGVRSVFPFHIDCFTRPSDTKYSFFFDLTTQRMLIVFKGLYTGRYECALMKFSIKNDQPVACAHWLTNQTTLLNLVQEQFAEQYSAHVLDQIINSP